MAREDIERLQQKIAKDPNSKLFVPLAEEYKKAGMVDEAINVLVQGLQIQPHYLSARVSLGKIYMGKGLLDEARDEFQKVIAIIPDNLYAHKKLAEIYQELGERGDAMKELNIVLSLNPSDEWAVSSLSAMEKETQQIPEEKPYEIPSATVDEEPAEMPLQTASGEEAKYIIEEQRDEEEAAAEEPDEEEISSFEDTVQEPASVHIAPDAEDYIKEGNYRAAMNTYKTILSEDPENRQVLQRAAELKALLKMLGKDQEAHILKLEGFLEGIKKRRNEFFGNT
jgi:tetratricopeptide (TPR) repeat protein